MGDKYGLVAATNRSMDRASDKEDGTGDKDRNTRHEKSRLSYKSQIDSVNTVDVVDKIDIGIGTTDIPPVLLQVV